MTRKPYTPERERLNVTPWDMNGKAPVPAPKPNPTKPRFELPKASEQPTSERIKVQASDVPSQSFVHVGNRDKFWFDDELAVGLVDNNVEVDTESLQGYDSLAQGSTDTETWRQASEPKQEPPQYNETKNFSFHGLQEGVYILVCRGEPIAVSLDLQQIKDHAEKLMIAHSVAVDDLQILKNLHLDFGLIVE